MRTLFLHAGMMKTGTTSIQVTLARSPVGRNYRYVFHEANNSSTALRVAFCQVQPADAPPGRAGAPQFRESFLDSIDRQLRQDCANYIISAEMISASFTGPDHAAMRSWLSQRVENIRVVVYVREPGSFIESLYQQNLKAIGRTPLHPRALYPKYRHKFEAMEDVFGRSNIVYRTFSPRRFVGQDVVLDFADLLELDLEVPEVVHVNDSLSRRAIGLLYVYHRFSGPEDKLLVRNPRKQRLLRLLAEVKGPKLRLHPQLIAKTLRHHEDDMRWMSRRLSERLPEYVPAKEGEYLQAEEDLLHVDDVSMSWLDAVLDRRIARDDAAAVAGALGELSAEPGFADRMAATRQHFRKA